MDRILRSTQAPIQLQIRDKDGAPIDATGTVSATVKNSAGITVHGPVNASHVGASGSGLYEITVSPTVTEPLDQFEVTWNATVGGAGVTLVTHFETVGGFLFTIAELRSFDTALANETKYPTDAVVAARTEAEERLEQLCGVAFVPRGRRETLDGTGPGALMLGSLMPIRVVSASIDGIALTSAQLSDLRIYDHGQVFRDSGELWTRGFRNVSIYYEHGFKTPPESIRRAAMMLARKILVPSPLPVEGVLSYTTAEGVFRVSVPGRDGPTGIPEVDAIIAQFGGKVSVG